MGAGRTEFELKFTGAPAEVAALPASDFFAAVAPAGGAWERLSSTYFDTPDGALAARGLSLRLREEGADFIQAVKARGAHHAERMEFESVISSAQDFPAATGEADIDEAIGAHKGALEPIAGTCVDRWAAAVSFKGAEIELAVDLGRSESRDGEGRVFTGPLAEVELELLSGDPAAVFDFARLIAANAPLRLSSDTKLEAALALQDGPPLTPRRKKGAIADEMTGVDVLAASLAGGAVRMAALQSALVDLRLPEGVHQMRVELRRLRAIERVFRRYLKTGEIAELAARAKLIAAALGPARDWDVFLDETLPAGIDSDYAPETLRRLKVRAEGLRADAWARAVATISGRDFTRFLLDATEAGALQVWRGGVSKGLDRPVREIAPKILDRALKKAVKTAEPAKGSQDIAARHPLRIALKKLRYPVQLFRGLYPKAARKDYMAALSSLQDAFGAVNDAVVAQRLADDAAARGGEGAMRAAGFISGYKAAEAREAAKKIDAAFDAFEKMEPFWRKP
jgi:inorganic triphosphatase YgiF